MNESITSLASDMLSDSTQLGHDEFLGQILLNQQIISPVDLSTAQIAASENSISLKNALSTMNIVLEDEINWAISRELMIPFVLLSEQMVEPEVVARFPVDLLKEIVAVPIADASGGWTLVMADPLDDEGFQRIQLACGEELRRAVAPSGRVSYVLDNLIHDAASKFESSTDRFAKDSSGMAAVYGMLVEARSRGANRILVRPLGDGLEAVFRMERGWISFTQWSRDQTLSIITRCRIMLGLEAASEAPHETSKLNARINGERISIEADFFADPSGRNIDIKIYPIISSPALIDFQSLHDNARSALQGLLTARRPTGVILINSPDPRQRYRMIYGLLATLSQKNLDMVSIEEKRYYDFQGLRRFQIASDHPEWEGIAYQLCEVLAIADAPYWYWRELSASASNRLLILGMDFATSWLAFKAFAEVIENQAQIADRLRLIWSGKRVDLTCKSCEGRKTSKSDSPEEVVCPVCDGYGHSEGGDLFEVFVPRQEFQNILLNTSQPVSLKETFDSFIIDPDINSQLQTGIEQNLIFNAVDYNE